MYVQGQKNEKVLFTAVLLRYIARRLRIYVYTFRHKRCWRRLDEAVDCGPDTWATAGGAEPQRMDTYRAASLFARENGPALPADFKAPENYPQRTQLDSAHRSPG